MLKHLRQQGGESTLRDLSEWIASVETGESPPPRNIRDSVYASLHQTHLPKLDDLAVVEYESATKTVTLTDRARELIPYTTVMSGTGLPWSQHYLLLGLAAMTAVIGAGLGVPVLNAVGPTLLAVVFAAAMVGSLVVQWTTGTRPLARLSASLRGRQTD